MATNAGGEIMLSKCPICHKAKSHGGNKKLAAEHSKMAQKIFNAEKKRLEKLNGAKLETKAVTYPCWSDFSKTGGRIFL